MRFHVKSGPTPAPADGRDAPAQRDAAHNFGFEVTRVLPSRPSAAEPFRWAARSYHSLILSGEFLCKNILQH